MYTVLGILLSLDVIVLVTWQVIDPSYRELESFPHEKPQDTAVDIEIKPQLEHCSSQHLNIWLGKPTTLFTCLILFVWDLTSHIRPQPKNANTSCPLSALWVDPNSIRVFSSPSSLIFAMSPSVSPRSLATRSPLGMDVNDIKQTCPIHLHLQRLTSIEMGYTPVISWTSLFEILLGKWIHGMFLRHLFWQTYSIWDIP